MHFSAPQVTFRRTSRHGSALVMCLTLCCSFGLPVAASAVSTSRIVQDAGGRPEVMAQAPGVPFTPDKLTELLPATVYFQGKTAPLQIRNSGGTVFPGGAIVWAALVDTSGYASKVQERYQFYLVTEKPLQFGTARLPPGAYGGGFVGERFLIMDVGGHTVAQGATQLDPALARPRPLQVLPDGSNAVKLYIGRHWVGLRAD